MGQLGERSGTGADDARTVEAILQTVTQDLKGLHQGLIGQLSQEVTRLQAEKARLMSDIEKLQAYYQTLQSRQLETLSQQQIAQQQLWAKQLAQVLATHLQAAMIQRLNQIASTNQVSTSSPQLASTASANGYSDNAHRLLASLDTTFSTTFKTLQRELDSYQSSLSQQINRMHTLEQQGEAILEALIDRLRDQLQFEAMQPSAVPQPFAVQSAVSPHVTTQTAVGPQPTSERNGYAYPPANGDGAQAAIGHQLSPKATPIPLEFPGAPLPLPPKPKKEVSQFQVGLLLVLLSTVALSVHNVVVGVLYRESTIFGLFNLGGVMPPTLGNSLLILWFRMLVVLPLMVPVAMFIYPSVWRDLKKFLSAPDRRPLFNVVGSGLFLFVSQVLIYIAIPLIGPGPAVTILFMYPIITVPLAWFLFGDRPTWLRWVVMGVILVGVIFTRFDPTKAISGGGVFAAVGAGVAFAFYLIFMQLGFKKLHPVPVSLVQFSTIFVLSSIILIFQPIELNVKVNQPEGFIVGGLVLGVLTLIGYLANNFGVRYMGAALASIVASSGPAMTALLALVIIQAQLQLPQWIGIFLVTGGVAALSFERMKLQSRAAKAPKPS